jgi:septum formation protein
MVQATRVMSGVRMAALTPEQMDAYVASGEWQGKAGGYGIQDNDPFVTRVSGSHTNIVGLPMEVVRRLLGAAGVYPVKK